MMMISKRNVERLVGGLLVIGFLAFLGHFVTLITPGIGRTTFLFVFTYGILVFLSAVTLYVTFRPHDETLALLGAFGFAAHGLGVVLTLALILAGLKFPEEFAGALELIMHNILMSAFVFLSLGLVPLGVLIAWSGAVSPLDWLAGSCRRDSGIPEQRGGARRCRRGWPHFDPNKDRLIEPVRFPAHPWRPAGCAGGD